jgi:hypothetical protein
MLELSATPTQDAGFDIVPARKLTARIAGLYVAAADHFETSKVETVSLAFGGIPGDFHFGATRRSGGREPWYPRGTEIRNERQLSIVSPAELAVVAELMGLAEIRPEWIGANLLLDGIAGLSMLPPGTQLFFKGGATLKIDSQNGPCGIAGRQVALRAGMADQEAGSLLFSKVAKRLRGLVAWVEKPGTLTSGEVVSVRVPEQWIYKPGAPPAP